jgi:hypothetical protein
MWCSALSISLLLAPFRRAGTALQDLAPTC